MYNFLCVGGEKYGCNLFTAGSHGKIVDVQEALSDTSLPLCWAGSHKETLYRHCIENNRKFYNLDTGYFGNTKRKEIIRVSINNLQDQGPIIKRPADRFNSLNLEIQNFKRGTKIVIVPPDEKISKVFNLSNTWVADVKNEIEKYTDRPIHIRNRPLSRSDRLNLDTFKDCIKDDAYAVVGYSSNALVESVMCGIPTISLGHSATNSLFNYTLSDIDTIPDIDQDRRYQWLYHLAYRQFTHSELSDGTAWNLLSAES
jgi:hypothetical protein